MSRVQIVTDSTADLPPDMVSAYGIKIVPLRVLFEQDVYRDGVDLSLDEFYHRLKTQPSSTSQPSPAEFVKVYRPLADQGASIISIHISAALSGTHQSALLAKSMLPEADIEVIDSRVTSIGLGLIALAAARAAADGKDKEEILLLIDWLLEHTRVYFMVDTLDYLQRGGRIGRASALLGTLLKIKPLLKLADGVVTPHERVRGRTKCLNRIADIAGTFREQHGDLSYAWLHGDAPALGDVLRDKLRDRLGHAAVFPSRAGAIIGTHVGPSLVGTAFHPAYKK